mmetsp:Transcript_39059/g.154701  ORF Transcript_39059/g.154701 Transcript_39059/m.154701 type:complete len:228 (-) Transcript_39059:1655-2338(-)
MSACVDLLKERDLRCAFSLLFLEKSLQDRATIHSLTLSLNPLLFSKDEDENAMNVLLRTEMAVDVKEFEEYFFPKADVVELTFSFKAFRAILELAEGFDVPLRIFFDKGGLPIVFIISYPGRMNQSFEAQFILATRQHITDSVASSRTDLQSTADSGRKPSSLAEKVSASTGPESSTRLGNTSIASFLTRGGELVRNQLLRTDRSCSSVRGRTPLAHALMSFGHIRR